MRTITRLAIQQRDKERVNIYLDDEFAFGLALEEAVRLKVGQQLSEQQLADLRNVDLYHRARARALDYLSRRPRSRQELTRYLQKHEVPESHIERVLERLVEVGLVDDLAFAHYWISNRETFRPRGARAIRYELRQKGVDATIVDQALEELELDEVDSAYRVALRKLPQLRSIPEPWQFKQKVAAYLGRKGFGWDVINQVSERLWQERDDVP